MYTSYATIEEYNEYGNGIIPSDEINKYLIKSSHAIDDLTFNRILNIEFNNLSEFQKNTIKEVNIRLANFYYENEDLVTNYLQSYSINGVSMGFNENSCNLHTENGIIIDSYDFSLLKQTGLTCLSFLY